MNRVQIAITTCGLLLAPIPAMSQPNGKLYIGSNGTGRFLDGWLDEVMIYNRVLAADEIQQIYNRK